MHLSHIINNIQKLYDWNWFILWEKNKNKNHLYINNIIYMYFYITVKKKIYAFPRGTINVNESPVESQSTRFIWKTIFQTIIPINQTIEPIKLWIKSN